jgi:hypothetical protein
VKEGPNFRLSKSLAQCEVKQSALQGVYDGGTSANQQELRSARCDSRLSPHRPNVAYSACVRRGPFFFYHSHRTPGHFFSPKGNRRAVSCQLPNLPFVKVALCLNRVRLGVGEGSLYLSTLLSRSSDAYFRHGSLNRLFTPHHPYFYLPFESTAFGAIDNPHRKISTLVTFDFFSFQVRTPLQCNTGSRTGNPGHYPARTSCCWH